MRYRGRDGRFISATEYRRRQKVAAAMRARARAKKAKPTRKRFTREQEELLQAMRKPVRDAGTLPAGTEFELTAVTDGGTPKRK